MYVWMDGWMYGWMDGWMGGWVGGWMGGWLHACMHVCMLLIITLSTQDLARDDDVPPDSKVLISRHTPLSNDSFNPAFSRGTQLVSFRFEYRFPVPEHRN